MIDIRHRYTAVFMLLLHNKHIYNYIPMSEKSKKHTCSNEPATQIHEHVFGLLTVDIISDFTGDMNKFLKAKKYGEQPFIFTGDICVCNITKSSVPNWISSMEYGKKRKKEVNQNNTQHRIVLIKYRENEYYFEKNGSINVKPVLDKYRFEKFIVSEWKSIDESSNENMNELQKLKTRIDTYILKDELNDMYKNFGDDLKVLNKDFDTENIDFNNIHVYVDRFNKLQQTEYRLIDYDCEKCIEETSKGIKKQSETVYNKNVYESDSNKYVLLDCKYHKIDRIEVADIYDKYNKLFFHNKKSGDLRTLGFQTIIGALVLKDEIVRSKYIDTINSKSTSLNFDPENFGYVVGIIQMTKTIAYKDKITLGIVDYHLEKMGIPLFVDRISLTNREKNTKSTTALI